MKRISQTDLKEILALIEKEFPYTKLKETAYKAKLKEGRIIVFKAVEKKELQGFIEIELMDLASKKARVNGLIVKKPFQHQGIGLKLVEVALEFLKQNNFQSVNVFVEKENSFALKIYEKLGFQIAKETEIAGQPAWELVFSFKQLIPPLNPLKHQFA